jgi:hypothetical protein
MRTICDRSTGKCQDVLDQQAIPAEVMAQVKHIVEQYLPGMKDANVSYSNKIGECPQSCSNCPSAQLGDHKKNVKVSGRKVITLSKTVPTTSDDHNGKLGGNIVIHRHYARMTLDKYGKLIKLAVSR